MRYLSVCSGIEAATVAWKPLGFSAVAFAEVDKFPSAVLKHHYPDVPNLGDMTRFHDWPHAAPDVLVGGTPCQSFSVAGLRKGLADPRGNLALTYLAVLDRTRPRWMVWENVPGALSVDDGRALGAFLGGLSALGYGWAYRSLDAQYFGLAQRRRRVFVVGHLGDWRRAAAVLFERESLSGHPAPRRETGQTAPTIPSRSTAGGGLGTDFDCDGGLIAERIGTHTGIEAQQAWTGRLIPSTGDIAHCLNAGAMGRIDYESKTLIAHSLRADGFDASEDGTGRGTPIIAQPLLAKSNSSHDDSKETYVTCFSAQGALNDISHGISPTIRRGGNGGGVQPAIAGPVMSTYGKTLSRAGKEGGRIDNHAIQNMQVRRLTPRECERLQGFPDDYTLIPYHGKPAKDGPRYKALGNSMAVPVMAWIGKRMAMMDELR
jgi:DNA (cytosine-5)-methyltransferase 1